MNMSQFRVTVWFLAAGQPDSEIRCKVVQYTAPDRPSFEADVFSQFAPNIGDQVWLGPITDKRQWTKT